jgi:hypothetical protein
VNQNATALRYASDELKSDRDIVIVLAAVNKNEKTLQFASFELKSS